MRPLLRDSWGAWFVNSAAKAPGQIIAMDRSEDPEGGTVYHPVFSFLDGSGIVHMQRSSFGSSSFSFESGESATVIYDAAAPKDSKIDSFQTVWLGPLLITGFGLLFGGFASVWLCLWSRAARSRRLRTPIPSLDG